MKFLVFFYLLFISFSLCASKISEYLVFEGNERVLDVGCGSGKTSGELVEKVPQGEILVWDSSQSTINAAQKNFPKDKYSNLFFEVKDIQMPRAEMEFDYLRSFEKLQWVNDHSAYLHGAFTCLKEGGKLIIAAPMEIPMALQQAVDEISMKEKWKRYFKGFITGWNFPEKESMETLLTENHFETLYIDVVRKEEVFPSKEVFQNFISHWFPYLRSIPTDLRHQFMGEVIQRFVELEPLDTNMCLHFNVNYLEIVAVKNASS